MSVTNWEWMVFRAAAFTNPASWLPWVRTEWKGEPDKRQDSAWIMGLDPINCVQWFLPQSGQALTRHSKLFLTALQGRPDFFINTTSLAAVVQLPIKIHSIDKDYLERREDLSKGTVKNIRDVVKSESRLLPHKTRASAGQPSSFPDSMLVQGCT